MTQRRGSAARTRTRGLVAAAGLAVLFIGVIGWFIARGVGAAKSRIPTPAADIGPTPELTDLSAVATDLAAIDSGQGLQIPLMDKSDPSRVAGELVTKKFEPLEARRYLVEEPAAWIHRRDGSSIHIRADRARLYLPNLSQEPESGVMEGNVIIRQFAAGAGEAGDGVPRHSVPVPGASGPGAKIDPETTPAEVTTRTESLSFDFTIGELSTAEPVTVEASGLRYAARGARVLFNQVQERIELLEVPTGGTIEVVEVTRPPEEERVPRLSEPDPARSAGVPAAAVAGETPEATVVAAPPPIPQETLYHAIFNGDVVVRQGGRVIRGEVLDVWARLLDNALPAGAIGEGEENASSTPALRAGSGSEGGAEGTAPGGTALQSGVGDPAPGGTALQSGVSDSPALRAGSSPENTGAQAGSGPENPDTQEQATLTWTGPLILRPVAEGTPPQLEMEHLALRFTTGDTGPTESVTFDDAAAGEAGAGASGECAWLEYGATTRELTLAGQDNQPAILRAAGSGEISAARIEGSLTTGSWHVPSDGVLQELDDACEYTGREHRWRERADFQFAVRDGTMTGALRVASFPAGGWASGDGSSLEGGSMRIVFVGTEENESSLSRLIVEDWAVGTTDDGRQLRADRLDVRFRPAGEGDSLGTPALRAGSGSENRGTQEGGDEGREGSIVPEWLTATGNVVAGQPGDEFRADLLDAELGLDEDGDVVVIHATGQGNVRFSRPGEGLAASADEMRADVQREIVDLFGEHARASRLGTVVNGTQIRLDGAQRALQVFGAGTFAHAGTAVGGSPSSLDAAWSEEMIFDDTAGLLDCVGDVVAVSKPDPLTEDRITAGRVMLELTPGKAARESTQAGEEETGEEPTETETNETETTEALVRSDQGRLLRATALGSILDEEDGANAAVESRRYVAVPEGSRADGGPEDQEGMGGARRLDQLLYLEGPRILADNVAGTLRVPEAGLLLIDDRREGAAPDETPSEGEGPSGPVNAQSGTSLFEWAGSMRMDRGEGGAGMVEMDERVRLTHKPLGAQETTLLEAEHLRARLLPEPGEGGTGDGGAEPRGAFGGGRLESARAWDAVYMSTVTDGGVVIKELLADWLDYDAIAGTAEAGASDGNTVTLFDAASASPMTASGLFWDLKADRVEVTRPGTITVPR